MSWLLLFPPFALITHSQRRPEASAPPACMCLWDYLHAAAPHLAAVSDREREQVSSRLSQGVSERSLCIDKQMLKGPGGSLLETNTPVCIHCSSRETHRVWRGAWSRAEGVSQLDNNIRKSRICFGGAAGSRDVICSLYCLHGPAEMKVKLSTAAFRDV